MNYVTKGLKWAYSDTLQSLGFLLSLALFIVFLMTLIAYPVQTIATIIIGGATIGLFTFWFD